MQRRIRDFVRAVLPAATLALAQGCGGGAGSTEAQHSAPSDPANPSATLANSVPTIFIDAAVYARVGVNYVFQPSASDADGDALSFSAANLPPWAAIDAQTG